MLQAVLGCRRRRYAGIFNSEYIQNIDNWKITKISWNFQTDGIKIIKNQIVPKERFIVMNWGLTYSNLGESLV